MIERAGFDVLFYANPQPMWIFDVNTLRILEVNAAATARYGYTHEEFLTKTLRDLRPVEDIPLLEELLPAIKEKETHYREFRHVAKNGTLLNVEVISYPITYEGVKARIVYGRSIDARKELVGKLELTQRRLLQILETTIIGFMQIDFGWRIAYWNKAAEELIGYNRQIVLNKSIWEVLPEILHSDFYHSFESAMTDRISVDFTDYFWPTQKWFNCTAYPAETGIIVHFRDITHKRLSQESLLEKIDQLKEISYLNSHALRKPVASLLGLTELVKEDLIKPGEFKDIAALINDCSIELDNVVNDVNNWINDEDYLQPFDTVIEAFDFRTFLQYVVDKLQPIYRRHELIIISDIQLSFYGNKQIIEQALRYLIDNAVKFSPVANRVIVKAELVMQNIVLSVEDFGVGMDVDQLHKLFHRINQKKHVNLSSGLPKINEVCRRHNGNMWIESVPGDGSTFYMRFPLSNVGAYKSTGVINFGVYRQSYTDISYNEEHHYLYVDWIGFHNLHSVKDGCLKMLAYIRKYDCGRIINDNSQVIGGWMDACDWIIENFFPPAEQAGLKHLAWVLSPSLFSKLSAQYTVEHKETSVVIQRFEDNQAAHDWLASIR
ncbi:PAS domain-containing sensor histidine kinase [Mucilaginibacter sp. PAMB04274]|uniref:sensor histidine kinase n=1 Tax=Mucilaginibacter sp. PAMB04274 TaxID=3138568 RepID=UPI0031F6D713